MKYYGSFNGCNEGRFYLVGCTDFIDLKYDDLLKKRRELYNALVDEYKKRKKVVDFTLYDVYIVFPKQVKFGTRSAEPPEKWQNKEAP